MDYFTSVCENNDYRRIYAKGKSYVSPLFVVYVSKNRYGRLRMGLTATKKIGNAVKRNRARRVLREAFRACAPQLVRRDYILVARVKTTFAKSTDVQRELQRVLTGAGCYRAAAADAPVRVERENRV